MKARTAVGGGEEAYYATQWCQWLIGVTRGRELNRVDRAMVSPRGSQSLQKHARLAARKAVGFAVPRWCAGRAMENFRQTVDAYRVRAPMGYWLLLCSNVSIHMFNQ